MSQQRTFRFIEKTWDEFWAEFWRIRLVQDDEAHTWKSQQVIEFCQQLLELKSGMRILDLGCGAGFQACQFAELGYVVHGIDITPKLVSYAKRMAKAKKLSATFDVGDMRSFSIEHPYDAVVVLGMSFGFGTDSENRETLRRIFQATKPGGKILLTGQHPYAASQHTGPEWMETADGFLLHHGQFNADTSRLGGHWQLVRPDGTVYTEGENPESDGIRCYAVPELQNLLLDTGFTHPRFYGSWLLPPAELQWFSMEMITFAEKPKSILKKKTSDRQGN